MGERRGSVRGERLGTVKMGGVPPAAQVDLPVSDAFTPTTRPMPHLLAVVVPSFALAGLAVVGDWPVAVRGVLVLWAVIGVPGLVVATRLGARTTVERVVVGGAAAAAATIVVSQVLLYSGQWSPELLLAAMGVLCVVGAGRRRLPR